MCALGCLVTWWKRGDINPPTRARNSRLGESRGWLLDHSLFFSLSPTLYSLSFSLSLSFQKSPIILGKFTISNLCPVFSSNDISTSQRCLKVTKIIPNSHLNYWLSFNYQIHLQTCPRFNKNILSVYLQVGIQERWLRSEELRRDSY